LIYDFLRLQNASIGFGFIYYNKYKIMNYTKEEFTQKLLAFFDRHDPLKAHLVEEIVEKFNTKQKEVFDHLTRIYAEKNDITVGEISNEAIFSLPPTANSAYIG
jgi:hypothetical protein